MNTLEPNKTFQKGIHSFFTNHLMLLIVHVYTFLHVYLTQQTKKMLLLLQQVISSPDQVISFLLRTKRGLHANMFLQIEHIVT